MNKKLFIIPLLLIFHTVYAQQSPVKTWEDIATDFRESPVKYRPNPLWFWNNTRVEPQILKEQVKSFKEESGYGGLSILPYGPDFEPEYLSEEYFTAYRACVEEAQKQGVTLWIYDEYGFPSGSAGLLNADGISRFQQRYPGHTLKRLDKVEYIPGKVPVFETEVPDGVLMSVVAMDTVNFKRISLMQYITEQELKWDVPKGNWKIMFFMCREDPEAIVDYLDPEASGMFIRMTHDEYYQHFGSYFGSTIIGTFFDEPTMYRAQGRLWTPAFNDKFRKAYGFDPALYYPALWYDIGNETQEARNYLFGFRSDLYARGYTKEANDWSSRHGVWATGHQDNEEIINPVGTSGDLMKCFKYLDIPGIDKIGGDRPAERFYKIVSSAAHNWDHSLVMSETYGAMGNISWNDIFGIAMDQYVKGINILIPHAVWYDVEHVAMAPELSHRSPIYGDSLKYFTSYLSRLNVLMQNDGRWMGDIAMLYPIETMQGEHYFDGPLGYYAGGVSIPQMDYIDVGVALFDSLGYDYMFLHPEILDQCKVSRNRLSLENRTQFNDFTTLIVPGCKTISLSNLQKINEFVLAGGTVIFTTQLPDKATVANEDPEVRKIVHHLFPGKKTRNTGFGKMSSLQDGKVIFIEKPGVSLLNAALKISRTGNMPVFSGSRIRNIHKVWNGRNIWFFANPGLKDTQTEFEIPGTYMLELWDPHTGKTGIPVSSSITNGKTRVQLDIKGNKSLFLIEK